MNAPRTARRFFPGGMAASLLTPSGVRLLKRGLPSNERIQLGFIGLGGMGRSPRREVLDAQEPGAAKLRKRAPGAEN